MTAAFVCNLGETGLRFSGVFLWEHYVLKQPCLY
jgi:hypothetical protein